MKIFLLSSVFIFTLLFTSAQNFTGQWKGNFMDQSNKALTWGGDRCEYVVDLECNGKKITGYSYTYFYSGSKKYYTICKLEGTLQPKSKYIEIKEVERTKTNVPANISNCFQVHKLTFFRHKDGTETLEGNWLPAPNQPGDCGFGLTSLSRRTLKTNYRLNPAIARSNARSGNPNNTIAKKAEDEKSTQPFTTNPRKTNPPIASVAKQSAAPLISAQRGPESIKEPELDRSRSALENSARFEKRHNSILRTIEIASPVIKIDLYDNGEVDGDSVSLFLNGKLIMAHQRLTTQPLTIKLASEDLQNENELVMYADNLGTIPPNTALMVVTDGDKRHEVRITSDLQKSGTILFVKKDQ